MGPVLYTPRAGSIDMQMSHVAIMLPLSYFVFFSPFILVYKTQECGRDTPIHAYIASELLQSVLLSYHHLPSLCLAPCEAP